MVRIYLILGAYVDVINSSVLYKDVFKGSLVPENNKTTLYRMMTRRDTSDGDVINAFLVKLVEKIYNEIEANIIENNNSL
jgi:hypothetical protein